MKKINIKKYVNQLKQIDEGIALSQLGEFLILTLTKRINKHIVDNICDVIKKYFKIIDVFIDETHEKNKRLRSIVTFIRIVGEVN